MITDTERLDFVLRFLRIEDIGEDKQRMAVVCDTCITDVLHKPWVSERCDLRMLIDMAIMEGK